MNASSKRTGSYNVSGTEDKVKHSRIEIPESNVMCSINTLDIEAGSSRLTDFFETTGKTGSYDLAAAAFEKNAKP